VLTLVNADRLRLFEGEFLNDSLINCFFKHHVACCLNSAMVDSAHVFSTFFFTKMLEAESER
jgi:Ulp1 family protease